MAKRGRKPKEERKGYFYEEEENAIVRYVNETDESERNKIFNTILYPALTKMIESIIRRYKLFVPDEEFEQNFNDTISYLLTKIKHFRPVITAYFPYEGNTDGIDFVEMSKEEFSKKRRDATKDDPKYIKVVRGDWKEGLYPVEIQVIEGILEKEPNFCGPPFRLYKLETKHYKAYSYCGTVCKNYLMYKCTQYNKKRMRNTPYDEVFEEISNSERYTTDDESYSTVAERLVKDISNEIERMIEHREENELSEEEVIVGNALVNLLRNWEDVLPSGGSNKLQKSSVLYFLREETMMTTKEVRDNMRKFKAAFGVLKQMELDDR